MRTPVLTVVIPAHNEERYVADAIRSAQQQTLRDLEIIVVDDGSTDHTWEIVEPYLNDARVRRIRQPKQGVGVARNTGMALANGEFIGFLDADDRWLPSKAAGHVRHLRSNPSIDVSFSRYAVIDEHGERTGRFSRTRGGSYSLAELLLENVVWNGQPVIRRAAVRETGGFDATLKNHEDYQYMLRLALRRERCFACLPHVLSEYRRRPGQMSADWNAMHDGWLHVLEQMRCVVPAVVAAAEREARARYHRYLAYVAWESRDYAVARAFLRRAWRTHPYALARDRRAWITTAALCASLLPASIHERLRSSAQRWRARLVHAPADECETQ